MENLLDINLIKSYLDQHHMSIYELSKRSGLDHSLLYRLLNGDYKNPSVRTVDKIANGMNIDHKHIWRLLIFPKCVSGIK